MALINVIKVEREREERKFVVGLGRVKAIILWSLNESREGQRSLTRNDKAHLDYLRKQEIQHGLMINVFVWLTITTVTHTCCLMSNK